ncbi:Na+/H+ antiporter NhaC family protein [Haloplasma contractile]|uniref:Membrane protein possible transporter n=1 Tax=Haloplasma contractile SSD-17B TaxID=1033810 RepID=U2EA52_9MOLU|nr:Na+/H+ antiporter NhaC family protein [Haloplasma contractile]ERJ11993.1 Membrane protein possible transporter [Haloplasma contractile SSD-17B]
MISKKIVPSLLIGLWIGSFIVNPGIIESTSQMVIYMVDTLGQPGNLNILIFMYTFSGLVAVIQQSGGVQGFSKFVSRYASGKKRTLMWVWFLAPITFIDCAFRVIATGSIMKKNIEKEDITKEKYAFMLNNSASPIVAMIPIGTAFVGYMVGVVQSGLDVVGSSESAYLLFVKSIPYNLFSIASFVVISLYFLNVIRFKQDEDGSYNQSSSTNQGNHMSSMNNVNNDAKPKASNLVIPILVLIPLSTYLMYWTGTKNVQNGNIIAIFEKADASHAILIALIFTVILSVIWYRIQQIKIKDMIQKFISGGNRIMKTIIILAVAWPIAVVSKDLGLPDLIDHTVGPFIPSALVPALVFIVTCFVAFFMGSSWASWSLMMPLAIPLIAATGGSLPLVIGAVFAGGTFGDVTSPLSGMVAMSSGIAGADLMKYVRYELPYNLLAAFIATIGFLIIPIVF